MSALTRTVRLEDAPRDTYSRSLGRQMTVSLVVAGDGGAVTLDVHTGWALRPFAASSWELGPSEDRPARDDGVHVHVDPCARAVDDPYEGYSRHDDCAYTRSGRCRHDVGGMAGHRLGALLIRDGVDAVWPELEQWYRDRIGDRVQRADVLDDLGDADALVEIGGGA